MLVIWFIFFLLVGLNGEFDVCINSGIVCDVDAGQCCSEYDYCGYGPEWCNERSKYGYNSSRNIRGICPNSGRICAANECCSEWGYCGDGEPWCNENSIYLRASDTKSPTVSPLPITWPTTSPTVRQPDQEFTGCPCIITGDPHIHLFNCFRINYQGPHEVNPPGSFNYLTPCNGFTTQDMPFEVVGVHTRWGTDFTALDYLIVKLYDMDTGIYYVRVSGQFGVQISRNTTNWANVDERINIQVGSQFTIYWFREFNGQVRFSLDVEIVDVAGCEGADLMITTQRLFNTVAQDSAQISISDCFKGFTCGLCGNFVNRWPFFETASGDIITVDAGYYGRTAENVDGFGYLLPNSRGLEPQRRILQESNYTISNKTSACFHLEERLFLQCSMELGYHTECCSSRHGFCERASIDDCKIDACACIAYNMDEYQITTLNELERTNIIQTCVTNTMSVLLNFTCNLPEIDFIIPTDTIPSNTNNEFCNILIQEALSNAHNKSNNCPSNKNGIFILIGIFIGLIIALIAVGIGYIFYLKPKPTQMENEGDTYKVVDINKSTTMTDEPPTTNTDE